MAYCKQTLLKVGIPTGGEWNTIGAQLEETTEIIKASLTVLDPIEMPAILRLLTRNRTDIFFLFVRLFFISPFSNCVVYAQALCTIFQLRYFVHRNVSAGFLAIKSWFVSASEKIQFTIVPVEWQVIIRAFIWNVYIFKNSVRSIQYNEIKLDLYQW